MKRSRLFAIASAVLGVWAAVFLVRSGRRVDFRGARVLVERYNRAVSEAYRRADISLIASVVAPDSEDSRKLTGLIGSRFDMGITLDAELLTLEIIEVEQTKDSLRVRTKENWRYRDRRIGTGEQVGEESEDSYEMLYLFTRRDENWLVDEIRFASAPKVGRQAVAWGAPREKLHRMTKPGAKDRGQQP